jgi:type II secretory pathway component PulF
MITYSYKAKNSQGETYEKTVEANNRADLYMMIRDEHGRPISIKEVRKFSFKTFFQGLFGGISNREKITFAKNLGSMIKAGLPVTRALAVMEKQTKKRSLKNLYSGLALDVSHGEPFSGAMSKYPKIFSPLFISMVRAGEESGNMTGALEVVANQMEKSDQIIRKVRGALIYPAVVISIMIIIAILMLVYMVPTLTATFEGMGVKLPLSTRIIIALSDFLISYTVLVLGGFIALVVLSATFLKSKIGHRFLDSILIRLPVIGQLVREVESARTARTLSSLLSAGVNVIPAFAVTIDVMQNHKYKKALIEASAAIEKGELISSVFSKYPNLYPAFVGEMVSVGEETGKISDMLLGVASYYEEEVDQKTKNVSTIIEPILMVIIGAGVGIFAISMLGPTYSLVEHI